MSALSFDPAQLINLGTGALLGEAAAWARSKLRDRGACHRVAIAFENALLSDTGLDDRVCAQLIELASPRNVPELLFIGGTEPTEAQQQWQRVLASLPDADAKAVELRLRGAATEVLVDGMSQGERLLYEKADEVRRTLERLADEDRASGSAGARADDTVRRYYDSVIAPIAPAEFQGRERELAEIERFVEGEDGDPPGGGPRTPGPGRPR